MRNIMFLAVLMVLIAANVSAGDYVIGGGDTLTISVWGNPELSIDTKVRPDGKISLPALGEIKAAGMTPMELTASLEKELSKIVKTPIVTVIVTDLTNYRVFVFGRGAPTGVYTLGREMTLLQFLSQLGPLENADLESSYVVRNREIIKTDFYALFEEGDFSQDIVLEPDDMLFIPDNFDLRVSVVGAVNQPTTITYRQGLTVLDVILNVGGFTEFANTNEVEILRKVWAKPSAGEKKSGLALSVGQRRSAGRQKLVVKAKDLLKGELEKNIEIMPGDIIVVKESLF